jgi:hypothetical protein
MHLASPFLVFPNNYQPMSHCLTIDGVTNTLWPSRVHARQEYIHNECSFTKLWKYCRGLARPEIQGKKRYFRAPTCSSCLKDASPRLLLDFQTLPSTHRDFENLVYHLLTSKMTSSTDNSSEYSIGHHHATSNRTPILNNLDTHRLHHLAARIPKTPQTPQTIVPGNSSITTCTIPSDQVNLLKKTCTLPMSLTEPVNVPPRDDFDVRY